MKLFDFGGMDKRHLPFREVEPEDGNVVVSISYSGTGHAFLVCTAGSQPKVRSMSTSAGCRCRATYHATCHATYHAICHATCHATCHALEINIFAVVLESILVITLSADSRW